MGYYLNTETIKNAYAELTSLDVNNASILHIFLILKAVGINKLTYEKIELISETGFQYAHMISHLFSPFEILPDKYDFINPFTMKSFGAQAPSEKLSKWVSARIKNNIIGGATTWRKILMQDANDNNIKFTYDYLIEMKNLTIGNNKISLPAMAVWANRFTVFERPVTLMKLCENFLSVFKIEKSEVNEIFHTQSNIKLAFYEKIHITQEIRNLIGNPQGLKDWAVSKDISTSVEINLLTNSLRRFNMSNNNYSLSTKLISDILADYYQVILSGPPGTSKSFYCNSVAEKYDEVIHLQFHPQYTYQQFIGGYVVEKTEIIFKNGVLLNLLNSNSYSKEKKYLIIIDEINRANVSQVFGELIQCLDRNQSVNILSDGNLEEIELPINVHIIATMNTTDRTIGSIDYALRRRFLNIYCPPNPEILIDLCPLENFISLCDLLNKLNDKLVNNLKNRELCLGHAIFLNDRFKEKDKYVWNFERLQIIFNHKILPIIEEYCYGNYSLVKDVLGEKLPQRLQREEFISAIKEYLER